VGIARDCLLLTAAVVLFPLNSEAGQIPVPNNSFESPTALFPVPNISSWQKTPKPDWYDDGGGVYTWEQSTGIFPNQPPGASDRIQNCDGNQAAWLFAVPEVGIFQDYDSVDFNDPAPTHEFDAVYEPGKSYQLTIGLFGGGAGGNGGMLLGVTLELSLYYRDANSNRVTVAATTITNSAELFTSNTNLVDFHVNVATVKATDAWAGEHIGILCVSTVSSNMQGGYWDLDNVRLSSTLAPNLINPGLTNGQFRSTLLSEPGMRCEILASTSLSPSPENWTTLGIVTNVSGEMPFVDTTSVLPQRFYRAQQLP